MSLSLKLTSHQKLLWLRQKSGLLKNLRHLKILNRLLLLALKQRLQIPMAGNSKMKWSLRLKNHQRFQSFRKLQPSKSNQARTLKMKRKFPMMRQQKLKRNYLPEMTIVGDQTMSQILRLKNPQKLLWLRQKSSHQVNLRSLSKTIQMLELKVRLSLNHLKIKMAGKMTKNLSSITMVPHHLSTKKNSMINSSQTLKAM